MGWDTIHWDETEGGNVPHIGEHGLTIDDVECALETPVEHTVSRSSGLPAVYGPALDGSIIFVAYEEIDEFSIRPVTAYRVRT